MLMKLDPSNKALKVLHTPFNITYDTFSTLLFWWVHQPNGIIMFLKNWELLYFEYNLLNAFVYSTLYRKTTCLKLHLNLNESWNYCSDIMGASDWSS